MSCLIGRVNPRSPHQRPAGSTPSFGFCCRSGARHKQSCAIALRDIKRQTACDMDRWRLLSFGTNANRTLSNTHVHIAAATGRQASARYATTRTGTPHQKDPDAAGEFRPVADEGRWRLWCFSTTPTAGAVCVNPRRQRRASMRLGVCHCLFLPTPIVNVSRNSWLRTSKARRHASRLVSGFDASSRD